MPVQQLGYQPYSGERLPPSHNVGVMVRHGIRRAWASWLVKIAVFLAAATTLFGLLGAVIAGYAYTSLDPVTGSSGVAEGMPEICKYTVLTMFWMFVSMATLGAGAAAISEDRTHKAYAFYFSKPVAAWQYLLGRIGAVALFVFLLSFIPALFIIMGLTATAPKAEMLSALYFALPTLVLALVMAATTSVASVGVSCISQSRALTMSTWLLILIIPPVIAAIVESVGAGPWLQVASLPGLFGSLADALYGIEEAEDATKSLQWWAAVPALIAITAVGIAGPVYKLRNAEVIG